MNRQVLTPPGLPEQWLVSLAHPEADMAYPIEDFTTLARALRG